MLASNLPAKFPLPWAADAGPSYIRAIPVTSQIGIQNGAASLPDGFPPLTFDPVSAGGTPPFGQDMNGILNQLSAWSQWAAAGGPITYDSVFSTAIGGYPMGAILSSASTPGLQFRSTVDNNETDPDSSSSAGWVVLSQVTLNAATTFYVRSGGSDTNGNGLTTGTAWATLQHAWTYIIQNYNLNSFTVTIDIGAGTFVGATFSGKGQNQAAPIIINGAGGTTVFSTAFSGVAGAWFQYQNLSVGSSGGNGVGVGGGGTYAIQGVGVTLTGAGSGSNGLLDVADGGQIDITANFTFTGGGGYLFRAQHGGRIKNAAPGAIVITGAAVNFDAYTVGAIFLGEVYMPQTTFTNVGGVTGQRFQADINGAIYADGTSPPNYFPGNSVGQTARGGQYA